MLLGLPLVDCTPRIPAAFTIHGTHNTHVGSTRGHSRSYTNDIQRGHRVHDYPRTHTQTHTAVHVCILYTRACILLLASFCTHTYRRHRRIFACACIGRFLTPALRYGRMMVEQELATSRAETRYLCCRWEENRRIKAVFIPAAFGLHATGPKGHRSSIRFSNVNTGMDVSQSLFLLCARS